MSQKHITWVIVLTALISSVSVTANMSTTDYQTEENNNVTITWDIQTQLEMSLTNLICYQSKPPKVLYQMINGIENTESQHQRFAGRVQLDRSSLKEGRVKIHLSTVTAEDSGNYWCDLAADYDKNAKRWRLLATECFVLNVAQNNNEENSRKSLDKLNSVLSAAKGGKHQPGHPLLVYAGLTVALVILELCALD
ncbi:uncharacterized protein [Channa argus]|uniref:uncharacterized protein isoform X3 n=1 Tax=Channa argus TaxID=215402 RepID=UPI00351FDB2F